MLKKPRRKSLVRNLLTSSDMKRPATQVKWAARTPHEFAVALEKTLVARREMGKEKAPHVVYTTGEWKQLKEYAKTRELPVNERPRGRPASVNTCIGRR